MTMPASPLRPVALRKDGEDILIIDWNDGHASRHSWRQLRRNCPCATCRDEREKPPEPFRILKPSEIPRGPLKPVAVKPVGYYAYSIELNDGHNTGIFTFDLLRGLCECDQCRTPTTQQGPTP
jgi:DUF971 family protein